MGSIYIASAPNGYAKIGCAELPIERFSMLQNGSPLILKLEYICKCPDAFAVESELHAVLAPVHRHREWFEVSALRAIELAREVIQRKYKITATTTRSKTTQLQGRNRTIIVPIVEIAVERVDLATLRQRESASE